MLKHAAKQCRACYPMELALNSCDCGYSTLNMDQIDENTINVTITIIVVAVVDVIVSVITVVKEFIVV